MSLCLSQAELLPWVLLIGSCGLRDLDAQDPVVRRLFTVAEPPELKVRWLNDKK